MIVLAENRLVVALSESRLTPTPLGGEWFSQITMTRATWRRNHLLHFVTDLLWRLG